ncbi:MAG TPA: chloride channel protein [Bacteroidales bacterium]|nr:chloride channel protein [Bacteroidales bacterium]
MGKGNFLFFIYPIIGLIITILFVNKFIRQQISHGVSRVLFAISQRQGIIKFHNTYSSIIASTITIGFGGSVGAEAPIVYTGAAIGSNLAKLFKLNTKSIILLVACGAAGAISGIFKAPIAGIIFCFEVLMLDLTTASLIPLLISSVTAATFAYFMMGDSVLFSFTIKEPFVLLNFPWYIVLGIVCGLLSLYFTKITKFIEKHISYITNPYKRALVGGAIIGIIIYLLHPLYGEGYEALKLILTGKANQLLENSILSPYTNGFWGLVFYMTLVLFFKVFAMALTTGSGGIGGVFAPSLFVGGLAGFITAQLINHLTKIGVSISNFSLVGMAGVMAGVMHAPLTAIFLIAEITGGYDLIIPLIITSTIAYITKSHFQKYSLYTEKLAEEGKLMTHDKDHSTLLNMNVYDLLETDFLTISPDATLKELVKVIKQSKRNIFPVVDKDNNLIGLVSMDNIRNIIFQPDLYDKVYVYQLMIKPEVVIDQEESMENIVEKLSTTGNYNIPVIKDGKYIGFVSRANVFTKYRNLLKSFSQI